MQSAVRTLASPFLPWVLAALKLVLLVGPFIAVVVTVGTMDIVHSTLLVAVWCLPTALAMQLDFERPYIGVTGEATLNAIVATKTLDILNDARDSKDETVWLLALLAATAFTLITQLDIMGERDEARQQQQQLRPTIQYNRRIGFALSPVIVAAGFAQAFLDPSLSTHSLLVSIETVLGAALVSSVLSDQAHETREVWRGGSTLVLAWIYLQLCTLPMISDPTVLYIQICSLVLIVIISIVMVEDVTPAGVLLAERMKRVPLFARVLNGSWELVVTFIDLLRLLIGSAIAYQAVVIACLVILVTTINTPWYTSHADFPAVVRDPCVEALDLIENVLRVVYEFTSLKEVQEIMVTAAPQIGSMRGFIFRYLGPNGKWLQLGAQGVTYTLTPLSELPCLIGLVIGPLVAAIGIVAQVMSDGASFVRSQWFWAWCTLGSLVFLALSQLSTGPNVTLMNYGFEESTYERAYTSNGEYALFAQMILVAACAALFVVQSQAVPVSVRLLRRKRASVGGVGARAEPGVVLLRAELTLARGIQRLVRFVTSPAFLLTMGAGVFLVIVIFTAGSPVQSLEVTRTDKGTVFPWLVSTDLDKASVVSQTLITMLSDAIGPEVRIALLLNTLIRIGVEQLNCVGCFCVPDGGVTSALKSAAHAIGLRRRRLLEQEREDEQEHYQPLSMNGTSSIASHERVMRSRALLSYDPDVANGCSRGASSCSTFTICVSDLLKPVAQIGEFVSTMIGKGLRYAVKFLVEQILSRIPAISRLIDVFERIEDIIQFDGFHPLAFADFSLHYKLASLNLGRLPSFRLPSVSTPSTATIVLLTIGAVGALVATYQIGLLDPLFSSTVQSLELLAVTSVITFATTLATMLSSMASELKLYGYEANVVLASSAWMYAVVAAVLLLAGVMWVGSTSAQERIDLEKELLLRVHPATRGRVHPSVQYAQLVR